MMDDDELRAQKIRDARVRVRINSRLNQTGKKAELKAMLEQMLTTSGWQNDLKTKCKEIVEDKGLERVTVDSLVEEITPYARSTVPHEVKQELLLRLKEFIIAETT
jgi:enhancer of yellow 2 transcription factor